jgi:soluble lytic murein transglycosylase
MLHPLRVTAAILLVLLDFGPVTGQAPGTSDAGGGRVMPTVAALELPPPDAAALERGLTTLEEALASARDEEYARAAELYLELTEHIPTLGDWAPMFAAEVLAEAGDTAGVSALLSDVPSDSPILLGWGWLARSRALEQADEPALALGVAEAAARAGASGPPGSLVWLRVGEFSLAAGDTTRAREAWIRAMGQGGDRYAIAAADALSRLGAATPAERYGIARVRMAQGELRAAIDGLEASERLDDLARAEWAQARLDLSRGYFSVRRYADTERTSLALLEDTTVSAAAAARALYWVGRARYRQGRREEGRTTLEQVAERFPDQRAAPEALYLLADLDHDADRIESALVYYRQILDLAPASTTADVVGMRLGSMAYLSGEYDQAAAIFDRRRAEAGGRSARQQAAYWSGLSYEAAGQADSALPRFLEAYASDPLSYYGSQAAARTGAALLSDDLDPGPGNGGAVREGALDNAVARLLVHMKVPTPGSFTFELERIKAHFAARPGGSYALAESLVDGGLPIQGIVLGREIQRSESGWNVRLLKIIYPFPHRELIVREAQLRQVNPFFAAGLIRQESMFDEDIESRAGAIGMMQVMPATGRELARAQGITPFSSARLTEAEINVQLGMTFLSDMLRRYDGEVLDALVAYNAGPTRIRRWRTYPEYRDSDVFTERIPFRETREYVKIVQQNALIYESLYGCDGEPCLGAPPGPVEAVRENIGETRASLR